MNNNGTCFCKKIGQEKTSHLLMTLQELAYHAVVIATLLSTISLMDWLMHRLLGEGYLLFKPVNNMFGDIGEYGQKGGLPLKYIFDGAHAFALMVFLVYGSICTIKTYTGKQKI